LAARNRLSPNLAADADATRPDLVDAAPDAG